MTRDYYKFGVELLDKKTKIPIEHIEYEEIKARPEAYLFYENAKIDEDTAKYLYYVDEDGEEMLLESEGYPETFENLGATSFGLNIREESNEPIYYSLNDFRVGDIAFDTALAEIRDKEIFDEFGNLIKEIK